MHHFIVIMWQNFKQQLFKNTINPAKATLIKDRLNKTELPTVTVTSATNPAYTNDNGKSSDVITSKTSTDAKDVNFRVVPDVASGELVSYWLIHVSCFMID